MSPFFGKLFGNLALSLAIDHPIIGVPLFVFLFGAAILYREFSGVPRLVQKDPSFLPGPVAALLRKSIDAGTLVEIPLRNEGRQPSVRIHRMDDQGVKAFDPARQEAIRYAWADIDLGRFDE